MPLKAPVCCPYLNEIISSGFGVLSFPNTPILRRRAWPCWTRSAACAWLTCGNMMAQCPCNRGHSQTSHHGLQIKRKCGSHHQYVCAEICSHLWTATCPISQNVSLKTWHQLTSSSHQLHICLRQNEAWNIIKCHNKKGQKAQCLPEPGWSLAAPEAWPPKLGL